MLFPGHSILWFQETAINNLNRASGSEYHAKNSGIATINTEYAIC